MNRVVSFPEGVRPEKQLKRFKWNGVTLCLLILFLSLTYQILSGLYNLFIYNRRLREMELLLQDKRGLVESLERKLGRKELVWPPPAAKEQE